MKAVKKSNKLMFKTYSETKYYTEIFSKFI